MNFITKAFVFFIQEARIEIVDELIPPHTCRLGMKNIALRVCVLLLFQGLLDPVKGELFTALVHMEGLLDLERELLASLNAYIVAEKER